MRFGLIGYGAWGRFHAEAIRKAPGAELAAIACSSEATAKLARERYPTARLHLDYRALLADASIDAVDIVVPNHLHAEIAIAALEAGKNVLLEKPMAGNIPDCDRIVAAVRRSGRVLSVGHEFRVSSQWGLIRKLIRDGEIGEPLYANVSLFRFPYRQGSGGWRYESDRVGSWILEEPVHFFDMLMWWFEELGDPHLVHGFGNSKDRGRGMYDNFSAVMRWTGGAYAVVTQTLAGFEHHHVVEITGREGSLRTWWSGTMDRTFEPRHELKVKRKGADQCEIIELGRSGEVFELEEELAATVRAFEAGKPLVSAEEARKRIIVCLEAERAVAEGCEVALSF
ncbi:myo-inositol 2-dehydrogenase / D-chiro-inositol 1-dehydrogenase [Rhizobiales bacterium GAS191]|nr:myo-inositol 2-dehydrogenase / D-chiro-inositol 1-dehydrogenase [Rhizobiales bacterium GAS188]SEE95715.1 myo-inositol 2-dehydrogenase / D-chiro-inositol 1-dehydrogenase [Rhizobiales bacterium GAS191]